MGRAARGGTGGEGFRMQMKRLIRVPTNPQPAAGRRSDPPNARRGAPAAPQSRRANHVNGTRICISASY